MCPFETYLHPVEELGRIECSENRFSAGIIITVGIPTLAPIGQEGQENQQLA